MKMLWLISFCVALLGLDLGCGFPVLFPHPDEAGESVEVGGAAALAVAAGALVIVMLAVGCTFCRRKKVRLFSHATGSQAESEGAAAPPDSGFHEAPAGGVAQHHNNNAPEDNNNGPISAHEMENIENNNAAAYIVSENENRNALAVVRLHAAASRESVVHFEPLPAELPAPVAAPAPAPTVADGVAISCDSLDRYRDWFESSEEDLDRSRLQYLREIGKGWFGRIVEGEAEMEVNSSTSRLEDGMTQEQQTSTNVGTVAVKILNQNVSIRQKCDFLSEAKLYRDLKHDNIIRLLAKNLSEDPWLLIFEFCLFDLKQYLLTNQPKMASLNKQCIPLRIVCEIAKGLAYIHSEGITHCDIACRNILIKERGLQAKIGDYGNSRQKYPSEYWPQDQSNSKSVRWCAPETTQTSIVSPLHDVWSFGVLLWEVCNWGCLPYEGVSDEDIISALKLALLDGRLSDQISLLEPSLPCPYRAHLYQVMQLCWNVEPVHRPTTIQMYDLLNHLYVHHQRSVVGTENFNDDFEARWQYLKPNTIPKMDPHITTESSCDLAAASFSCSEEDIAGSSRQVETVNLEVSLLKETTASITSSTMSERDLLVSQTKSDSLTNLHGSLEDIKLTLNLSTQDGSMAEDENDESEYEITGVNDNSTKSELGRFDPWLKDVVADNQDDMSYYKDVSDAIKNLDNILNSEKTSSSESSHQASPSKDNIINSQEIPVLSSMVKSPGISNFQSILQDPSEVDFKSLSTDKQNESLKSSLCTDGEFDSIENCQQSYTPPTANEDIVVQEMHLQTDEGDSCTKATLSVSDMVPQLPDLIISNNSTREVEQMISGNAYLHRQDAVFEDDSISSPLLNKRESVRDAVVAGNTPVLESIIADPPIVANNLPHRTKNAPSEESSGEQFITGNSALPSMQQLFNEDCSVSEQTENVLSLLNVQINLESSVSEQILSNLECSKVNNGDSPKVDVVPLLRDLCEQHLRHSVNKVTVSSETKDCERLCDNYKLPNVFQSDYGQLNNQSDSSCASDGDDLMCCESNLTPIFYEFPENTDVLNSVNDNCVEQELNYTEPSSNSNNTKITPDLDVSSQNSHLNKRINSNNSIEDNEDCKLLNKNVELHNTTDINLSMIELEKIQLSSENNNVFLTIKKLPSNENMSINSPDQTIPNLSQSNVLNKKLSSSISDLLCETASSEISLINTPLSNEVDINLSRKMNDNLVRTTSLSSNIQDFLSPIATTDNSDNRKIDSFDIKSEQSQVDLNSINSINVHTSATSSQGNFASSTLNHTEYEDLPTTIDKFQPVDPSISQTAGNVLIYNGFINNAKINNASLSECSESFNMNDATVYMDLPDILQQSINVNPDKTCYIQQSSTENPKTHCGTLIETNDLSTNVACSSILVNDGIQKKEANEVKKPTYGPEFILTKLEQNSVSDSLLQNYNPTEGCYTCDSVTIGPFENCTLDLYSGLKTQSSDTSSTQDAISEDEALGFSSNFNDVPIAIEPNESQPDNEGKEEGKLQYSIETWDKFLGSSFENEKEEENFDSIFSNNEEKVPKVTVEKNASINPPVSKLLVGTASRLSPSTPPNSPGTELLQSQAQINECSDTINVQVETQIDECSNDESNACNARAASPDSAPLPLPPIDAMILNDYTNQFTAKLAMAENENNLNIEHSSPLNLDIADDMSSGNNDSTLPIDELLESTRDNPSTSKDTVWQMEAGSSSESLTENSYREGFGLDEECMKALRNELELKLPLAQAPQPAETEGLEIEEEGLQMQEIVEPVVEVVAASVEEVQEETKNTTPARDELLISYLMPLSPILEETCSEVSAYENDKPWYFAPKSESTSSYAEPADNMTEDLSNAGFTLQSLDKDNGHKTECDGEMSASGSDRLETYVVKDNPGDLNRELSMSADSLNGNDDDCTLKNYALPPSDGKDISSQKDDELSPESQKSKNTFSPSQQADLDMSTPQSPASWLLSPMTDVRTNEYTTLVESDCIISKVSKPSLMSDMGSSKMSEKLSKATSIDSWCSNDTLFNVEDNFDDLCSDGINCEGFNEHISDMVNGRGSTTPVQEINDARECQNATFLLDQNSVYESSSKCDSFTPDSITANVTYSKEPQSNTDLGNQGPPMLDVTPDSTDTRNSVNSNKTYTISQSCAAEMNSKTDLWKAYPPMESVRHSQLTDNVDEFPAPPFLESDVQSPNSIVNPTSVAPKMAKLDSVDIESINIDLRENLENQALDERTNSLIERFSSKIEPSNLISPLVMADETKAFTTSTPDSKNENLKEYLPETCNTFNELKKPLFCKVLDIDQSVDDHKGSPLMCSSNNGLITQSTIVGYDTFLDSATHKPQGLSDVSSLFNLSSRVLDKNLSDRLVPESFQNAVLSEVKVNYKPSTTDTPSPQQNQLLVPVAGIITSTPNIMNALANKNLPNLNLLNKSDGCPQLSAKNVEERSDIHSTSLPIVHLHNEEDCESSRNIDSLTHYQISPILTNEYKGIESPSQTDPSITQAPAYDTFLTSAIDKEQGSSENNERFVDSSIHFQSLSNDLSLLNVLTDNLDKNINEKLGDMHKDDTDLKVNNETINYQSFQESITLKPQGLSRIDKLCDYLKHCDKVTGFDTFQDSALGKVQDLSSFISDIKPKPVENSHSISYDSFQNSAVQKAQDLSPNKLNTITSDSETNLVNDIQLIGNSGFNGELSHCVAIIKAKSTEDIGSATSLPDVSTLNLDDFQPHSLIICAITESLPTDSPSQLVMSNEEVKQISADYDRKLEVLNLEKKENLSNLDNIGKDAVPKLAVSKSEENISGNDSLSGEVTPNAAAPAAVEDEITFESFSGHCQSKPQDLCNITDYFIQNERKNSQFADCLPMLADIRFSGPSSDYMTTSFNQESPTDEQTSSSIIENEAGEGSEMQQIEKIGNVAPEAMKEWESESDDSQSNSTSSGEFIWKQQQQRWQAPHEQLWAIEEECASSADGSSGRDGEEVAFVPSSWDCSAAPAKSALRDRDIVNENKKRVVFKRQKYHCVYEYPREICDNEGDMLQSPYLPEYTAYTDWELFGTADMGGSEMTYEQLMASHGLDLYHLPPVPTDSSFSPNVPLPDEDFFISSSARPFESLGIMTTTSQFFPGMHASLKPVEAPSLEDELVVSAVDDVEVPSQIVEPLTDQGSKTNLVDFTTPDSGMEDVTPGSTLDYDMKPSVRDGMTSPGVDVEERAPAIPEVPYWGKQIAKTGQLRGLLLPGRCSGSSESPSPGTPSPLASSGSDSPLSPPTLGGLRHTRDRLKLDLPPSPLPAGRQATRDLKVFDFRNLDFGKRRDFADTENEEEDYAHAELEHEDRPAAGSTTIMLTDETPEPSATLALGRDDDTADVVIPKPTFSTFGKVEPCIDVQPPRAIIQCDDCVSVHLPDRESEEKSLDSMDSGPVRQSSLEICGGECKPSVEPVKGEGTLLDSGDEDSGIESSAKTTLERKVRPTAEM